MPQNRKCSKIFVEGRTEERRVGRKEGKVGGKERKREERRGDFFKAYFQCLPPPKRKITFLLLTTHLTTDM